jgi:Fumarylacetoacetate (FAA) hydrolase family
MWLDVNGEKRQRGDTSTVIFDCQHIVWACSQYFVMEPGDVIITGTPPGVGLGIKPEPKIPQGRRRSHARHRRLGRATAEDREVQDVSFLITQLVAKTGLLPSGFNAYLIAHHRAVIAADTRGLANLRFSRSNPPGRPPRSVPRSAAVVLPRTFSIAPARVRSRVVSPETG